MAARTQVRILVTAGRHERASGPPFTPPHSLHGDAGVLSVPKLDIATAEPPVLR